MISFKYEAFLEVARRLSFTKASEVLCISQPAISKHIQSLEQLYKTSLFERKGNGIALTTHGQILLDYLLRVKSIEKQLEIDIGSNRNHKEPAGVLKVGASTTVALYVIPSVLAGFRKKFPKVELSLLNRNSEYILQALLAHEIDLGIIEGKKKMAQVLSHDFLTDEVVPICSVKSKLAREKSVSLARLREIPVALRERGSGTLAALKAALSLYEIALSDLNVVIRLGGTEALKNFVLADDCLGFLPSRAVMKELQTGELVRIFIDGLTVTRHFFFVQRFGEEGNELNTAFIKFARLHYNIRL